MVEINENFVPIILKKTQESDLDFVVECEHQPDNAPSYNLLTFCL